MRKQPKQADRISQDGVQVQLREINQSLNRFLQQHFTIEIESLQQYLNRVKDLLIQLTTHQTPIISNVFSKFSNILQPFTTYSYDLSLDSLKQEITMLRDDNHKLKRKVERLKIQLQDYRVKSSKSMQFIYMLRVNNINIDQLFRKSLMHTKINPTDDYEEEQSQRRGPQLHGEELLQRMAQESNLSSQYVSVKSKR